MSSMLAIAGVPPRPRCVYPEDVSGTRHGGRLASATAAAAEPRPGRRAARSGAGRAGRYSDRGSAGSDRRGNRPRRADRQRIKLRREPKRQPRRQPCPEPAQSGVLEQRSSFFLPVVRRYATHSPPSAASAAASSSSSSCFQKRTLSRMCPIPASNASDGPRGTRVPSPASRNSSKRCRVASCSGR